MKKICTKNGIVFTVEFSKLITVNIDKIVTLTVEPTPLLLRKFNKFDAIRFIKYLITNNPKFCDRMFLLFDIENYFGYGLTTRKHIIMKCFNNFLGSQVNK